MLLKEKKLSYKNYYIRLRTTTIERKSKKEHNSFQMKSMI